MSPKRKTATPWNSVLHFCFSSLSCATHVYQHQHHHLATWDVGFMLRFNPTINIPSKHIHTNIQTSTYQHLISTSTSPSSNMRTYGGVGGVEGACLRWVAVVRHVRQTPKHMSDDCYCQTPDERCCATRGVKTQAKRTFWKKRPNLVLIFWIIKDLFSIGRRNELWLFMLNISSGEPPARMFLDPLKA